MKIINNNKGVTLIELLAYTALSTVILTIIFSTFVFSIKTYNRIDVHGQENVEANKIMSALMYSLYSYSPDYIEQKDVNTISLVKNREILINPELGIISEQVINNTKELKIENNSIYFNSFKLNSSNYKIVTNGSEVSSITYTCFDKGSNFSDLCQSPLIEIKLVIIKVDKDGNQISDRPYIFVSRISY